MERLRPEMFFLLAGLALAACTPDDRVVTPGILPSPTGNKPDATLFAPDAHRAIPTLDNRPSYPKTPTAADLKPGIWLSAFNAFINPETRRAINELENLFPDPIVRARVGRVLIENDFASRPGGPLSIMDVLRKNGQIIGVSMCADSRVICDTVFYGSDKGKDLPIFGVSSERNLGGVARVFDNGVNFSVNITHCNSAIDKLGCGALSAWAKINEPGGADILRKQGIADDTIDLLKASISSADPDIQAVVNARLQAEINAIKHGGARHVTVAAKKGLDGSFTIIDAFDNLGNRVPINDLPEHVRTFLAVNSSKAAQIDAFLAMGQKPLEYVVNTTRHNTEDLMGKLAAQPGHTFKVTGRPKDGNWAKAINMSVVADIKAAIDYPLDHDWGKLFWIFARNPEELALIRTELLNQSTGDLLKFLGNGGTMVEVVVDDRGKITDGVRITRLKNLAEAAKDINALRKIGVATEVIYSQRALRDAERLMKYSDKAEELVTKYKTHIDGLKSAGKMVLRVVGLLNPIFNAESTREIVDGIQSLANMNVVYDRHAFATDGRGRKWGIANIMTTPDYVNLLRQNINVEPYMVSRNFDTIYTKDELSGAFWGLVELWKKDVDVFGGTIKDGPKNPNSQFYGIGADDLFSVLIVDYMDPNAGQIHKKFAKVGKPLIFKPLPVATAVSPAHIEYSSEGLKKQPFIILNPDTGEFLMTGMPGEIIVPVKALEPRNGIAVTYYLYLRMDEQGNLHVKSVGYQDPSVKGMLHDPYTMSLARQLTDEAGSDSNVDDLSLAGFASKGRRRGKIYDEKMARTGTFSLN